MGRKQEERDWEYCQKLPRVGVLDAVIELLPECQVVILALRINMGATSVLQELDNRRHHWSISSVHHRSHNGQRASAFMSCIKERCLPTSLIMKTPRDLSRRTSQMTKSRHYVLSALLNLSESSIDARQKGTILSACPSMYLPSTAACRTMPSMHCQSPRTPEAASTCKFL